MIKNYGNLFMAFAVATLLIPCTLSAMQLIDLDEDKREAYLAQQAALEAQQDALLEAHEQGAETQTISSETPKEALCDQDFIQAAPVAHSRAQQQAQTSTKEKKSVPCLKFFAAQAHILSGNGASLALPRDINTYVALCKIAGSVGQKLPKKFINEGKISRNLLNGKITSIVKHGYNPLAVAMHFHYLESFDALIAAGVNPNVRDSYGSPLLVLAAHDGNDYYVDRLLELPAIEVDAVDSFGETALTHAVRQGHASLIKTLIDHGANALISNIANKKPSDCVSDPSTALSLLGTISNNVAGNVQARLWVKNDTSSKFELVVQPK